MRIALLLVCLLATASLAAPTVKVHLTDDLEFKPKVVTVKAGTTIEWDADSGEHSVVADDNSFKADSVNPKKPFSHAFTKAGTYPYHCAIHGDKGGKGMAGIVKVTP